jgi:hypothetical protein
LLRRRPTLVASIVFACLSLLMVSPGLAPGRCLSASDVLRRVAPWDAQVPASVPAFGSNSELSDSAVQFQPFLQTTRSTLPDIPLWNPYVMGGRPYVGNSQSAVFSLFSLPAYVLPFWDALALIAAFKLFVAALGTYLLGRALGMRFGGALLAGSVFGFSLWMVAWLSWPLSSVWAYLPWLCLLADRMVSRPGPLPFMGVAVVVALQFFAGHPESSFHVLVFAGLFWVLRMATAGPADARTVAVRALQFGGALLLGTALAAIAVIPFVELLVHSVDVSRRAAEGPQHGPAHYLFGLLLHDYWGRQTRVNLVFPISAMEERSYYVGALTLMLAVAAVVLRPAVERIVLACLGACFLAVATGLPPLFGIVTALPGFHTAENGRLAALSVFCLALLAGWGLDELAASVPSSRRRRVVLMAVCAALLAYPVIKVAADGALASERLRPALRYSWTFAESALASLPPTQVADLVHFASLLEWLVLGGAAVALVLVRLRGRLGSTPFVAIAVLLVAADLFKAGVGWNPAIPTANAQQPASGALGYLLERRPRRFVALNGPPFTPLAPMAPDVAMRYRLYDARGYDFPVERRYEHLWRRYIAASPTCSYRHCGGQATSTPQALRALGLLGVADVLQDPTLKPLSLRVAYAGPDARVYANPDTLPRAFLVDRQQVIADESKALAFVGSPRFAPRAAVVTERRLPGLAEGAGAAHPAGRAHIETYEAERVVADTVSEHDALLVLTDLYFPGWKVTVDGDSAPIRRVDYLLRGVSVPGGRHRVEFRYQPASWRVGWIVSGLALLVLIAVGFGAWRRDQPTHFRPGAGMFES